MSQAVLRPNLTKKCQWEVSQIAKKRFSHATLLGGLSVNLNHLKIKNMYSNAYFSILDLDFAVFQSNALNIN